MFSITIDDPNCEETFIIQSRDEGDFIYQVLRNPLVEFWLENADPEEVEDGCSLDCWEWYSAYDLMNDIRDWACCEATIIYEGVE
jgi:hypothetical protein